MSEKRTFALRSYLITLAHDDGIFSFVRIWTAHMQRCFCHNQAINIFTDRSTIQRNHRVLNIKQVHTGIN